MHEVDLDQNTQAWLEVRKKCIGGSDVPSIMGVSPWRTVFQLWEEKLGICTPDQSKKAYIFWKGHRFEVIARQNRELTIGFDIPSQVVQSDQFEWARVSLDCFNLDQRYVGEIKFMGVADWHLLKEEKIVPDHYMPQLQYQLFVTGFPELEFIGINEKKQLAMTTVRPDPQTMSQIVKYCQHFWRLVQVKRAPKQNQQDFKFLTRKVGIAACNRIYRIDSQISKLFKERISLQNKVLAVAKSTRMAFQGKILIRTGDFDHEDLGQIEDLKGLDLEYLGRSVKDDLKLIIIKNTIKGIKGASHGKKGSKKKQSKRKRSKAKV